MRNTAKRIKDEFISDVLLWTHIDGRASVEPPARTVNTVCSLENLQGAIDDWDGWREGVWEIRASSTT